MLDRKALLGREPFLRKAHLDQDTFLLPLSPVCVRHVLGNEEVHTHVVFADVRPDRLEELVGQAPVLVVEHSPEPAPGPRHSRHLTHSFHPS